MGVLNKKIRTWWLDKLWQVGKMWWVGRMTSKQNVANMQNIINRYSGKQAKWKLEYTMGRQSNE